MLFLAGRGFALFAGLLNDLYKFSSSTVTWTALSPSGPIPSPRSDMGFTATPDGTIYLFGGYNGGG